IRYAHVLYLARRENAPPEHDALAEFLAEDGLTFVQILMRYRDKIYHTWMLHTLHCIVNAYIQEYSNARNEFVRALHDTLKNMGLFVVTHEKDENEGTTSLVVYIA